MRNKVIVIAVLVLVIAVSGCVNSDMENINQIIPKLNDNIRNGDSNFNHAVEELNSGRIDIADAKTQIAIENFNNTKVNIRDIQRTYKNLNNTNYIDYIDLISKELEFKINATLSLQSAIQRRDNIQLFNSYVNSANSYMQYGLQFQNERDILVQRNSDLFN